MIFGAKGLPKDNGATDYMDSARLAGLLSTFSHPAAPSCWHYIVQGQAVRHPDEFPANNPKNFTRDQLLPLIAGFYFEGGISSPARKLYEGALARGCRAQNTEADVPGSTKKFPNGADILNPFHMLVLATAAGKVNPFWALTGRLFAIFEILFNAAFTPTREPNQLLCSLMVLGPAWVRFYKHVTPKWKEALILYWTGWRNEVALASFLIERVDRI